MGETSFYIFLSVFPPSFWHPPSFSSRLITISFVNFKNYEYTSNILKTSLVRLLGTSMLPNIIQILFRIKQLVAATPTWDKHCGHSNCRDKHCCYFNPCNKHCDYWNWWQAQWLLKLSLLHSLWQGTQTPAIGTAATLTLVMGNAAELERGRVTEWASASCQLGLNHDNIPSSHQRAEPICISGVTRRSQQPTVLAAEISLSGKEWQKHPIVTGPLNIRVNYF